MIPETEWQQLDALIERNNKFFLLGHMNPDGYALGSQIGFYHYLQNLGKIVHICNPTLTPAVYRFLDRGGKILQQFGAHVEKQIAEADVIVMLDVSVFERLKKLGPLIDASKAVKVIIDHHPTTAPPPVDMLLQDTTASSTGEIVYEYITRRKDAVTPEIADALYVALLTDTGSFRFNSTTAVSHHMAAALLDLGVDSRRIYEKVYESGSRPRMKLLAMVISDLHFAFDGQLVHAAITRKMLKDSEALREDIDGFVEFISGVRGAEIGMLFVESPPNNIKMSVRSKGRYRVNDLAGKFGGGGHPLASGALVRNATLDDATRKILSEVEKLLAAPPTRP